VPFDDCAAGRPRLRIGRDGLNRRKASQRGVGESLSSGESLSLGLIRADVRNDLVGAGSQRADFLHQAFTVRIVGLVEFAPQDGQLLLAVTAALEFSASFASTHYEISWKEGIEARTTKAVGARLGTKPELLTLWSWAVNV